MTPLNRTRRPSPLHTILVFGVTATVGVGATTRGQTPPTPSAGDTARAGSDPSAQRDDKLRVARRAVEEFAARATDAMSRLDELTRKLDEFDKRKKALLTNDDGKRLACDEPAFHGFMQILDHPDITGEQIATQKRRVAAILSGLQDELRLPTPGYLPDEAPRAAVEDAAAWAKGHVAAIVEMQTWFDATIAKAPKDIDLSKRTTLEDGILRFRAARRAAYVDAIVASKEEARREMQGAELAAAKQAEIERIERELRDKRAENERQRVEFETRMKEMEVRLKQQMIDADNRYKDLLAKLEREQKLADARRTAEDVKTDIEKKKIEDAADKQKRIQRCKDPQVQQVLAPFLAPGYWQPGERSGSSIDKKPISLSKLTAFGALQPTADGIQKLLRVATKDVYFGGLDKVRPRWPYPPLTNRLSEAQMDEVKKAQAFLIELGPVMVEQGMLSQ